MFNEEQKYLIDIVMNTMIKECEKKIEKYGLHDEATLGTMDTIKLANKIKKIISNNKRVFLYVKGGDYSALEFGKKFDTQEVYEDMVRNNESIKVFQDDYYYIEVEIVEFNVIDDDFIDFTKTEFLGCEEAKHSDIFDVDYIEKIYKCEEGKKRCSNCIGKNLCGHYSIKTKNGEVIDMSRANH